MNAGAVVVRMSVLVALMTAAHGVLAADGVVIWRNYDCGFFILQTKTGYGLYEWMAGPYPNESDIIEGELQRQGEHRVNNKTADVPTTIFLDTFSAKRGEIAARIPAKCKTRPGYIPFEGQ